MTKPTKSAPKTEQQAESRPDFIIAKGENFFFRRCVSDASFVIYAEAPERWKCVARDKTFKRVCDKFCERCPEYREEFVDQIRRRLRNPNVQRVITDGNFPSAEWNPGAEQ